MNKAFLLDIEITDRIVEWGRLEQIKDVLLVDATLMTSEMTLSVRNDDRAFSPRGLSLIGGIEWYNKPLRIFTDETLAYEGLLKSVKPNVTTGISTLLSENILRLAAESAISFQALAINPARALLSIARLVMTDDQIDVGTFEAAGGPSRAAGASIDVDFPTGENVTALEAFQEISALSSISVFIQDQKLVARAFIPYQGSQTGLREELTDDVVREWAELDYDYSSFNNRVQVGYPTNQYTILNDAESQREVSVTREIQFDARDKAVASNLRSATFFGTLYLKRASRRRAKLALAVGTDLKRVAIGDRFPVTQPGLGYDRHPFECIEVRRRLDTDETELVLAELFEDQ